MRVRGWASLQVLAYLALTASCAQIVGLELDAQPKPDGQGGIDWNAGGSPPMGGGAPPGGETQDGGRTSGGGGALDGGAAGSEGAAPGMAYAGEGGSADGGEGNGSGCEQTCAPGEWCTDRVNASAAAGTERVCLPNHCGNGKRDGDEEFVDCGGSCGRCDQVPFHAFRVTQLPYPLALYRRAAKEWVLGGFLTAGPKLSGQPGDVPVLGVFDQQGGLGYALFDRAARSWSAVKLGMDNKPVPIQDSISLQVPPGDYVALAAPFLGALHNFALWSPDTGTWYVFKLGSDVPQKQTKLGKLGDIPVPGNYDGIGTAEYAVFNAGTWTAQRLDQTALTLPSLGDQSSVPVPCFYDAGASFDLGTYDGDGRWRAVDALTGKSLLDVTHPPAHPTSLPLAGDFDADGICDPAYWDPVSHVWESWGSTAGYLTRTFPAL